MKNRIKNSPGKILTIIIFTGIVCIFGIIHLSKELRILSNQHEKIMKEEVANYKEIETIKALLYEHHSVVVNHLLTDDAAMYINYEYEEQELIEKLKELIIDFSEKMKGSDKETIYHEVYSDFAGYKKNVETIFKFSNSNEKQMAIYYNDNVLKSFLNHINSNFDVIENVITEEISNTEEKMAERIKMSRILRIVIIVIVCFLIIFCTILCFEIARNLDKYKENLETELEIKNNDLRIRNEKMMKLQDDIIIGMANLLESRDGETGNHIKRVSDYVEMIARKALNEKIYTEEINENYIQRLRKVAPLHDIGKIVVSDVILLKPGKLTDAEYEIMKTHAKQGGEIIDRCFNSMEDKKYLQMAKDVATFHHEWWDGTGYYWKINGKEIPLSARIVAIADVFDALVSERCYKKAYSRDESFNNIKNSKGTQFDPVLVDIFMSLRPEIEKYLDSTE